MSIITQFAKMQLRAGVEAELPGSPITTSPLVYSPPLDPALMAFATDTGRLFIGHQPNSGQVNYNRLTLPYQNLEVLTEGSDTANKAVFAKFTREITPDMSYATTLATATVGTWVVLTQQINGFPIPYVIPSATTACEINYALSSASNVPSRLGTLMVLHDAVAASVTLIDRWMGIGATSVTESLYASSSAAIQFRFTTQGPTGATFLQMEYQNSSGGAMNIKFRTKRLL